MNNSKSWYTNFDHPKLLGDRSLAVVVDSNGTPSYRYRSNTPMNNNTVLEPYVKRQYPSYPFTRKKLGKSEVKTPRFNPTNPNSGYNPPRRAYIP